MKNHKVSLVFIFGLISLPIFVFAQSGANVASGITTFAGLINTITNTVVKSLATLFLSLALLAFFYGIVEYIWAKRQGDGGGVKKGGDFMTWGLVALFVMFSVYGIIQFGQNTLFGTGVDVTTIKIPNIQFKTGGSADLKVGQDYVPSSGTAGASLYSPNTAGNGGGLNGITKTGVSAKNARPSTAEKKAAAGKSTSASSGVDECYWDTGSNANYLDGASCNNGSGICSNAKCDTTPAGECYFSQDNPDFLNGDSCNGDKGVCASGSCVSNSDNGSVNNPSCPTDYYYNPSSGECVNSAGNGTMVGTSGACTGLKVGATCTSDGTDSGICEVVSYDGVDGVGCVISLGNNSTGNNLPGIGEKCNKTSPRCASGLFCDGTILTDTYNTCRPDSENVDYSSQPAQSNIPDPAQSCNADEYYSTTQGACVAHTRTVQSDTLPSGATCSSDVDCFSNYCNQKTNKCE